MKALSQTILENAISSLKEALEKYKHPDNSRNNPNDQYKFAILFFIHFLELSFKYYLTSINPLLLYSNPFDKKLANPNNRNEIITISLDQAIQFLENNGTNITQVFKSDLKFIKKIRNQIMHSEFSLVSGEVDEKLGRIANFFNQLNEEVLGIELTSWLTEEDYSIFEQLCSSYLAKLKNAQRVVEESKKNAYAGLRPKEASQIEWNCYICPECGEDTQIPCSDSKTGYRCAFCNNEESDEIDMGCSICGSYPGEDDDFQYICSYHKQKMLGK